MLCPTCKKLIIYSDKWDAYYCQCCNIWLEPGCGGKEGDNDIEIE